MSESTVRRGVAELENPSGFADPVEGANARSDTDPTLKSDLEKLLESTTRGEPQSPLRWTCKSIHNSVSRQEE